MKASHQHYETCFPFMETWDEASGQIKLDIQVLAHEYQGGLIQNVNALGFLDNKTVKYNFSPVWAPSTDNEVRNVSITRATSSISRCGRVESRNHVEGQSPNGHERQFSSTGWQSLFACKPGRSNSSDRGPGIIFRGWYLNADYCNVTFTDDFRGATGFRASEMDDPVQGDLKLKINVASCTNPRWMVLVNPDIHNGSYGVFKASGVGDSATVTIPASVLPASGTFRVAAVGCETIGNSAANPNGGQNCGVGVLPFTKGGSPPPPPPPPLAECEDGIDNDADLLADFPADPGCASASDDDESDAPPPPPPNAVATLYEDAYVAPGTPTANFGNDVTLRAFNSGTSSYLKVDASGTVEAANLSVLLTVTDPGQGGCFYAVADNSWSESTLTYNNRPALGAVLDCHPEVVANGTQVLFDLGVLPADGVYSFALAAGGADAVRYGSSEAVTPQSRPQLALR
jgi:hypothetical protein